MRLLLCLVAGLALAGCATRPGADDPEALAEFEATNDPIEPWNRAMFQVNEGIDTLVLRPAAEAYRILLPQPVRLGVRNVLGNLRTPVILLNDALQGETDRFGTTLGRFLLNSTLGIGGIFDVAAEHFDLPGHTEDFGQTLAVWGVREGPYLFIPVLGPSNPRDVFGFGVDIATHPLTWVTGHPWEGIGYGRTAATAVDTREGLIEPIDEVRRTSLDPYATFRSAYRQIRATEIANTRRAPPAAFGTGLGVAVPPSEENRAR
jgi:phospholipid-binding lipoprotein MlaA